LPDKFNVATELQRIQRKTRSSLYRHRQAKSWICAQAGGFLAQEKPGRNLSKAPHNDADFSWAKLHSPRIVTLQE
jgi:hypothetical protein